MDSGFQVLVSSLCQWNVDSGFRGRIPIVSGILTMLTVVINALVQQEEMVTVITFLHYISV